LAPTDDADEDRRRLAGDAALGHAWDWFALHAKQRMQCVNFFLLAMAFLVAAFVTAVKDHEVVAAGIGLLGALVTGWFHRLEIRTKELVKAGEAAMEPLEGRLAEAVAVPALDIVSRVRGPGTEGTSYGTVLNTLYRTMLRASLFGVVYALYHAARGPDIVASIYRHGTPGLLTDPVRLTGLGLVLGVLAALLLAFLPPPHWSHYTRDGASHLTFTGRQTRWGTWLWWLSYSGPVLLAASFALQYLAWRAGAR
jgi:hypothetical protein